MRVAFLNCLVLCAFVASATSLAGGADSGSIAASRRAVQARLQDYGKEFAAADKAQGRACLWGLYSPRASTVPVVLSAEFRDLNSYFTLYPHEEALRIRLLETVTEDRVDELWLEIDALTLRVRIVDRLYRSEIAEAERLRDFCQRAYLRTDRVRHLIWASQRLVGFYDQLAAELEIETDQGGR